MIWHYVECLYPGIFPETTTYRISKRLPEYVILEQGMLGFRFYDREETGRGITKMVGVKRNYSGWYYRGKIMTLKEVEENIPKARNVIENMKMNGWDRIVRCSNGQCFPYRKDDSIISG